MRLTSHAFLHGEPIPQKYGRDFDNVNPPLTIGDVPEGVASLVLIMEDPDVPVTAGVSVWDHWVVFNIPPTIGEIPEYWEVQGVRGQGTRGELEYGGPRPPDRVHRYFFRVFALDNLLSLQEGVSKNAVVAAMQGHILDSAEVMGTFRPNVK